MESVIIWLVVLCIAIGCAIMSVIRAVKSHRELEYNIRNKQVGDAISCVLLALISVYFLICFFPK